MPTRKLSVEWVLVCRFHRSESVLCVLVFVARRRASVECVLVNVAFRSASVVCVFVGAAAAEIARPMRSIDPIGNDLPNLAMGA